MAITPCSHKKTKTEKFSHPEKREGGSPFIRERGGRGGGEGNAERRGQQKGHKMNESKGKPGKTIGPRRKRVERSIKQGRIQLS